MSTEMFKLGSVGQPCPCEYGKKWDYKGRSQVCQIFISYGDDTIYGLRFQYLDKDSLVLSDRLGSMFGPSFKAIKLDYPSEYITWVKIKSSSRSTRVCLLAFKTNLGKLHGPFPPTPSNPDDDMFSSGFDLGNDNQFGGFYGTSDGYAINSLGIYVQPMSSMKSTSTKGNLSADNLKAQLSSLRNFLV
ncbi:hypothetical protein QQ045_008079 [Rhodiola kirilowii]